VPGLPPAFRSIPDGQDLLEAFAESFTASAGWVFATGFVEDVELRLVAAGADTRRALSGRYVLAQLSGPLAGPYGVTLSRLEGGRVELLAGILVRARSAGVNACCLSANAELMLAMDPPAAEGPAAPVANAPAVTGTPRWAAQVNAAAAARLAEKEPAAEVEEPERGDLVQHFAFGVCEVLSVTGDRLLIRDLSRTGRVLEIHVDMLVVHPPVERDGKRLFRLSRRG
jgi:hypothetical protein